MIEVADVFRRFAADYLAVHGASMPPSHRRAIADILDCRTAALGGQVWRCEACNSEVFSYHSCNNRGCPKCHTAQTQEWLERRQAEMLAVPYFHITITVPAELRAVLRAHQRAGYGALMQASAAAIIELARDPRYVGGTVAVLAVLHTWTQQLHFHPHVHCLVSGGGISADGSTWHPARQNLLLPIKPLATLVRGKFRALLRQKCPDLVVPDAVWHKSWILHVSARGKGEQAVLDYLARDVCRVALTNARIVGLDDNGGRQRGQHPIQGPQDRPATHLPAQRRRVHAPLPPACAAAWLPQGPLLRPVASHAAPQRRPDPADAAAPGTTQGRLDAARPGRSTTRPLRRDADAADRAADLSALSGAADLRPPAHPATGDGAMSRGRRHHFSGLAVACPSRHRDPLSPTQVRTSS
jgi:hypothetical protein